MPAPVYAWLPAALQNSADVPSHSKKPKHSKPKYSGYTPKPDETTLHYMKGRAKKKIHTTIS